NPGIKGTIQIISDKEIELRCNTEDDFDPPVTWESMEEMQIVSYEFIADNEFRVSLSSEEGESTLAFVKLQ
ncbi:MAG: hypothetical protein IKU91_03890, partial [Anaerotignum sp.]|nr:hypothetical protein [Anaerotignum sp.]